MADITEELNVIENAVSGEAVRSAVVSAISKIYSDLGGNSDRMSDILEGLRSGTKGTEIKESLVGGVEETNNYINNSDEASMQQFLSFISGKDEEIVIPEGVTYLTNLQIFNGQTQAKRIHMPSTIVLNSDTYGSLFSNCAALEVLEVPMSVTDGAPWGAPESTEVIFY